MSNFWNENGLVNGRIPAGKPCPFWKECWFKQIILDRCPTDGNIKDVNFSCATARLFSLIKESKKREDKNDVSVETSSDNKKGG